MEDCGIVKVKEIALSLSRGVTVLLVYVDEIIVPEDNEEEKIELIRKLMKEFEIKELGKYSLGIEVAYSV